MDTFDPKFFKGRLIFFLLILRFRKCVMIFREGAIFSAQRLIAILKFHSSSAHCTRTQLAQPDYL